MIPIPRSTPRRYRRRVGTNRHNLSLCRGPHPRLPWPGAALSYLPTSWRWGRACACMAGRPTTDIDQTAFLPTGKHGGPRKPTPGFVIASSITLRISSIPVPRLHANAESLSADVGMFPLFSETGSRFRSCGVGAAVHSIENAAMILGLAVL
jgi:hypothetical protein